MAACSCSAVGASSGRSVGRGVGGAGVAPGGSRVSAASVGSRVSVGTVGSCVSVGPVGSRISAGSVVSCTCGVSAGLRVAVAAGRVVGDAAGAVSAAGGALVGSARRLGVAEAVGRDVGVAEEVGPGVAVAVAVTGAPSLVGEGLRVGVELLCAVGVAVGVAPVVAVAARDGSAGCAVDSLPSCLSRPGHESQTPAASASNAAATASPLTQARGQLELAARCARAVCMRSRPRTRPPGDSTGRGCPCVRAATCSRGAKSAACSGKRARHCATDAPRARFSRQASSASSRRVKGFDMAF